MIFHNHSILLLHPSWTLLVANNLRASGNARCSANLILSVKVSTVSEISTGTTSCTIIAPASTSSWKFQVIRYNNFQRCVFNLLTIRVYLNKVHGTTRHSDFCVQSLFLSINTFERWQQGWMNIQKFSLPIWREFAR